MSDYTTILLQGENAANRALQIRPGDVGAMVALRNKPVIDGGKRRKHERDGECLKKGEVLSRKSKPIAREAIGAIRLFYPQLPQFRHTSRFKKS